MKPIRRSQMLEKDKTTIDFDQLVLNEILSVDDEIPFLELVRLHILQAIFQDLKISFHDFEDEEGLKICEDSTWKTYLALWVDLRDRGSQSQKQESL